MLARLAPQRAGVVVRVDPALAAEVLEVAADGGSVRAFVKAVRARSKARFASAGCFSRRCTRASCASVRAIAYVAFVSVFDTHGPVACGWHGPHAGTFVCSFATASFCPGRISWCMSTEPSFTSS